VWVIHTGKRETLTFYPEVQSDVRHRRLLANTGARCAGRRADALARTLAGIQRWSVAKGDATVDDVTYAENDGRVKSRMGLKKMLQKYYEGISHVRSQANKILFGVTALFRLLTVL
jgi:hypothetical protein